MVIHGDRWRSVVVVVVIIFACDEVLADLGPILRRCVLSTLINRNGLRIEIYVARARVVSAIVGS